MAPPSPVRDDGVSPSALSVGTSIDDAIALFSNRRASYAVSFPKERGDGPIRVARIIPGGFDWSYRQLFDHRDRNEDADQFSPLKAYEGVVVVLDSSSFGLEPVDAYVAPVQLKLFPLSGHGGPRSRETIAAPRSLWRSFSRCLHGSVHADAGAAKAVLRDIVDSYAANVLGARDAAAPYLVPGSRFSSQYSSDAVVPLLRERLRGDSMPGVASRVGAVQFARAIDNKPLIERDGIVDLVGYLNERAHHGRGRSHRSAYGRRGVA